MLAALAERGPRTRSGPALSRLLILPTPLSGLANTLSQIPCAAAPGSEHQRAKKENYLQDVMKRYRLSAEQGDAQAVVVPEPEE